MRDDRIRNLSHLKVGDPVFVDATWSSIGGTTYRLHKATVEKITPSGIVTVKVDGTEVRYTFQPDNRERGNKFGASIVSEEHYKELLVAAEDQRLEREARAKIRAVADLSRHSGKDKMLTALREAPAAVEAMSDA